MTKTAKRPPAAQAAASKKAAALKAENAAKREQPAWLRRKAAVVLESETPVTPERRVNAANQSQGPPRLLDKGEILTITRVSFPTVWQWMRAGTFPRSRIVGGKSMWLSTEVSDWLDALPVRPLKGDAPTEAA